MLICSFKNSSFSPRFNSSICLSIYKPTHQEGLGLGTSLVVQWLRFLALNAGACTHAKSFQSCPTLCDPIDCSPPGSSAMGFSRQQYWSGWPCSALGDLLNPGIEPTSVFPALAHRFFLTSDAWEAQCSGPGFKPWSGNWIPHAAAESQQKGEGTVFLVSPFSQLPPAQDNPYVRVTCFGVTYSDPLRCASHSGVMLIQQQNFCFLCFVSTILVEGFSELRGHFVCFIFPQCYPIKCY